MTLDEWLEKHYACDEGKRWAQNMTLVDAWTDCPNPNWMLWLLEVAKYPKPDIFRKFALRSVERVLHLLNDEEREVLNMMWEAIGTNNDNLRIDAQCIAIRIRSINNPASEAVFCLTINYSRSAAYGVVDVLSKLHWAYPNDMANILRELVSAQEVHYLLNEEVD